MSVNEKDRSHDRKRDRTGRGVNQTRERSLDRGKARGALKASSNRVLVSNIPYEYSWQDLKDLFRNEVGDVSYVELFLDDEEKSRGCGIVEFADTSSVDKCFDVMQRFDLMGRKLVIKEDFGSRDKFGNSGSGVKRQRDRDESRDSRFRSAEHRNVGMGFERSQQDNVNTYGLSPQFLDSLGINVPLISRIFIANLDYKVNKKKLKEVFRLAGRIQNVDLSFDRDGNSRGFAIVEYDHPVEAVQAISMFQNQILYDRVIAVRMDREGDRPMFRLPDGLKGIGMGLGVNGEPLRDVTRNLSSMNNSTTQGNSGSGNGILGSVPNVQLGLSGALGNLASASSALNSLNTNAAVLQQAANLAGVGGLSSNLLASSLGGGDLGLASLVQNQSLAALTGGNQSNSSYLSGGRGFEDKKPNFGFTQADRDNRSNNQSVFTTPINNGTSLLRSNTGSLTGSLTGSKPSGGYSNKILISNLPPTCSYKMLSEKCNEFGEVQRIEDKGGSGVLVAFATEWEAERAIKNMDRARIDGRTIDVRFFY